MDHHLLYKNHYQQDSKLFLKVYEVITKEKEGFPLFSKIYSTAFQHFFFKLLFLNLNTSREIMFSSQQFILCNFLMIKKNPRVCTHQPMGSVSGITAGCNKIPYKSSIFEYCFFEILHFKLRPTD